jgi:hypothetical protein
VYVRPRQRATIYRGHARRNLCAIGETACSDDGHAWQYNNGVGHRAKKRLPLGWRALRIDRTGNRKQTDDSQR